MNEPKDGDFVAYIEALQRESAARLGHQHLATQANPAQPSGKDQLFPDRGSVEQRKSDVEAAVERVLSAGGDRELVKAMVAAVFGLAALMVWMGRGGALSFLIAVGLLVYAVPRLITAFRAIVRPPSNRTTVDQVFGKSGKR